MTGHKHTWTSKPGYPEDGVFCMECGQRKGQKPFRKENPEEEREHQESRKRTEERT